MINIAHVHPMLVHFPIVLFFLAITIQVVVLMRKGDLAARECLPTTALVALALGLVFALAAAVFGDIALDQAVDLGFPKDPLEEHEDWATVTMFLFGALTLVQLIAWWRGIAVIEKRGWIVAGAGAIGLVLLLSTAYHGGELVYHIGVNVDVVKP